MAFLRNAAFAALIFGSALAAGQGPPRVRSVVGDLRMHAKFHSTILNNDRDVTVWLPPGYETEPRRRYPVLYMGDGQNVFNLETSFLPDQEWRADETANSLIEAGLIEPVIIVGVPNAGIDRANEYLPTAVRGQGGRADRFARMMVEELKPMIDRTYRTKRDAGSTGLGGSSFGGIMTLAVGLAHPDVFGKLAVLSPSVWWDDRTILKTVDALPRKTRQRIWVDIGTNESQTALPDTQRLRDRLVAKGWREGNDLVLYIDQGAQHNERAWAGRLDAILMYLFPKR